MADEKKAEEIPAGYVMANIPKPKVWNGRLFGKGSYPIPSEAKDWLEGKVDATENPPAVGSAAAPAPPATATHGGTFAGEHRDAAGSGLSGSQSTVVVEPRN